MALWFIFAMMTAAAIFAVLWPLGRSARPLREGSDLAVYKDQLAEVDRDVAAGLTAAADAGAARVEISRRVLSADAASAAPFAIAPRVRRAVAVVALAGLPALAAAFYLPLGSPKLPDFPLASRETQPATTGPLDRLVAQVEARLEQNPSDARGWIVLAPVLNQLGRYDDAARAWRNSITYGGDNAQRRSDLGEALVSAANGIVTSDAKAEFERAIILDADDVKARYFLGLAAEQDGRSGDAATIWRAMLAAAPQDAPWRALVQAGLARVGGPSLPVLSESTIAAANTMSEADRTEMVRGMVERLAARLSADRADVQGWLRLVRAYMVLGDRDKAAAASGEARQALAGDAARLRTLTDGLKSLGLDG